MERQAAKIIAEKAIEAIKEAFADDTGLQNLIVSNAGGSLGSGSCTIKISFVDKNHKPTSILGGDLSDNVVAIGAAGSGVKIMFRGKKYTVVRAARKYYHATDEQDKLWSIPFSGATLAKD